MYDEEVKGMSENASLVNISRYLGYSQMEYFLLDQLAKPLLPVAWIGGINGEIQRVTKTPVVHAFDLAQMLGIVMMRIEKVSRGGRDKDEIIETDLLLLEILLVGASSACMNIPSGRLAGDSQIHLQRLLRGERFVKYGSMRYSAVPFCSGTN